MSLPDVWASHTNFNSDWHELVLARPLGNKYFQSLRLEWNPEDARSPVTVAGRHPNFYYSDVNPKTGAQALREGFRSFVSDVPKMQSAWMTLGGAIQDLPGLKGVQLSPRQLYKPFSTQRLVRFVAGIRPDEPVEPSWAERARVLRGFGTLFLSARINQNRQPELSFQSWATRRIASLVLDSDSGRWHVGLRNWRLLTPTRVRRETSLTDALRLFQEAAQQVITQPVRNWRQLERIDLAHSNTQQRHFNSLLS